MTTFESPSDDEWVGPGAEPVESLSDPASEARYEVVKIWDDRLEEFFDRIRPHAARVIEGALICVVGGAVVWWVHDNWSAVFDWSAHRLRGFYVALVAVLFVTNALWRDRRGKQDTRRIFGWVAMGAVVAGVWCSSMGRHQGSAVWGVVMAPFLCAAFAMKANGALHMVGVLRRTVLGSLAAIGLSTLILFGVAEASVAFKQAIVGTSDHAEGSATPVPTVPPKEDEEKARSVSKGDSSPPPAEPVEGTSDYTG